MKRILLAFLILSLSLSFVIAVTYEGDGTYHVTLTPGEKFIADNGWSLELTNYQEYGPYAYNSGLSFKVTSPKGVSYDFNRTIGNNPDGTTKIQVNSTQSSSDGDIRNFNL